MRIDPIGCSILQTDFDEANPKSKKTMRRTLHQVNDTNCKNVGNQPFLSQRSVIEDLQPLDDAHCWAC